MKGLLVVAKGCEPCINMKKELAPQIASGEIELVDFDTDPERVAELMSKYALPLPGLVIIADDGTPLATG